MSTLKNPESIPLQLSYELGTPNPTMRGKINAIKADIETLRGARDHFIKKLKSHLVDTTKNSAKYRPSIEGGKNVDSVDISFGDKGKLKLRLCYDSDYGKTEIINPVSGGYEKPPRIEMRGEVGGKEIPIDGEMSTDDVFSIITEIIYHVHRNKEPTPYSFIKYERSYEYEESSILSFGIKKNGEKVKIPFFEEHEGLHESLYKFIGGITENYKELSGLLT